jgi:hypothetical protein
MIVGMNGLGRCRGAEQLCDLCETLLLRPFGKGKVFSKKLLLVLMPLRQLLVSSYD